MESSSSPIAGADVRRLAGNIGAAIAEVDAAALLDARAVSAVREALLVRSDRANRPVAA
jgi:hypothetical protein